MYIGGGDLFDTVPDMTLTPGEPYREYLEQYGDFLVNLGDVNGDNYTDIFVGGSLYTPDYTNGIYFGGPDFDSIPDLQLGYDFNCVTAAGDINNDGYNDILISQENGAAGYALIYLGGPDIDSIYDRRILQGEAPMHTYNWGWECEGIGDVNGDRIDDFAVSALSSMDEAYGYVYIFSGWQDPIDVEYDYRAIIPDRFMLDQNYPNPFNLSTTIGFDIPSRQAVSICIFDILGRKIRELLDKSLAAGKYKISWDGLDDTGRAVSSGIYIYRLKAESTNLSRKMILLK